MKKAMPIVAVLLLGLVVCSAVLARTISGYVYFDTAKAKPAACSEVFLYDGISCLGEERDGTIVDASGYYEFTGLPDGYYSTRARWGFVFCAQCDTSGSECGSLTYSTCGYTVDDSTDASIDLIFDIDCECEGD
jgi:hypothetical protein